MHGNKGDRGRGAKISRELDAARAAYEQGQRNDLIYHLRVAEALCLQDEVAEPPPPPRGASPRRLLEVADGQGRLVQWPARGRARAQRDDAGMKRTVPVEPGIFRRISPRTGMLLPTLWIHYSTGGRVRHESARTTSIRAARALRARRLAAVADGEELPDGRVTLRQLLDELAADYVRNERTSLASVKGSIKAWLAAGVGPLRPTALTPQQLTAIG